MRSCSYDGFSPLRALYVRSRIFKCFLHFSHFTGSKWRGAETGQIGSLLLIPNGPLAGVFWISSRLLKAILPFTLIHGLLRLFQNSFNAYFVNLCFPDSKLSLHGVHFLLFLWSGTTSIQWYDCMVVSAEADRCCRLNNGLQCLTLNLQSEISGSISQSLKDRELLGCYMFRDDVYLIFSTMQQIIASEWPHRPNLCFLLSHPPLFSLCFFQAFDRRRLANQGVTWRVSASPHFSRRKTNTEKRERGREERKEKSASHLLLAAVPAAHSHRL